MKKFQDKNGGSWNIELTIGTVQRVKSVSEGKFNLYEPSKDLDGKPMQDRLYEDPGEFWELLWHLVEPQAREKQTTAEQFGELMAADCLIAAQVAFFNEWHDFFQSLQRPDKAAVLEKLAKFRRKAVEMVNLKLQDPRIAELERKTEARMQSTLNSAFGDLLATSELTLVPSPGDSSTK